MPTTIESLELEVQSSSTSAIGGIDALSASLSKLKNAVKGGVGLTSVANQIRNVNTALQGIDSSSAGKLDTLSNSLSKLSGLGNIKISSSIGNQLQSIGTAATSLNGVDFSGIRRLGLSLQPLTTLGKSNLTPYVTQLGKLPQLAQTLNAMNIPQFASQLNQLSSALAPLASQLNTVSSAFSRLPTNIRKTVTATNAMATANNTASASYINLWAKLRMARAAVMSMARVIASWITESNSYVENLNLFTASMGEYTEQAKAYANQVADIMGIDPGEWMRNQGVFMTITEGFGVASDRAYIMSKNLTQLGYDLSSFFNIPFEESMQKLTSGISGELEPLRRLGYDLSVARLQQEAYNLGINRSVSSMTQAEKAQLRYYAIMTQVTTAQGDMARTLNAPANQLRILKSQVVQVARALGNVFIPVLNIVLPYLIAFAKVLRMVINLIGKFVGFTLPEIDYSGISAGSDAVGDLADSEGDATKAAKKLKNALLGIDELNVISPNDDSSGGSGSGIATGGDLGFELPEYDFLDNAITQQVEDLVNKFKEWAGLTEDIDTWAEFFHTKLGQILILVGEIAAEFLAWKIAKGVLKALKWLSTRKGFSLGFKIVGLGLFLDSWNTIKEAIEDIQKNGANFTNVTKLISGFAEGLGAAFLLLGDVKLGGAALVIAGVTGIVSDISDMCKNGINWDNATSLTKNIGLFIAGIGLAFGNLQLGGIGLMISGVSLIVQNFKALVKGFTEGDFSEVNWIEVATGTLMLVGGLILAFKTVNTIASGADLASTTSTMTTVANTTGELSTTVGSSLVPKLANLAKDLALGIVIIAEVAVAAVLIVGAIWVLGLELEQVGIAWQPVIANGQTVAIAMGLGTAILVTVGVVTALLGSLGGAVCGQIAIGIAILAELGVAAGLFIIEIWAIGKGLDEIGKAWQPVLDNGDTIATGIGLGTALLVGIGVVTAALGVATVASYGLLPLAIALGTALLVELAAAFIIFTESLVAVADELSDNLSPSLTTLNGMLPTLSTNMGNFVDYMTEFAGQVVSYTEVSAIAGLASTIDTIIGWFTEDPIDKLADDVSDIYDQTSDLNEKLNLAVPELETAIDLLEDYQGFLAEIENLTNSNVNLNDGQFANMEEVGENIVTGFVDGIESKSTEFSNTATTIVNGFKNQLVTSSASLETSFTTWATNLKNWFTQNGYGAINSTTFEGYAKNVVTGFSGGISSNYPTAKSSMTTFANSVKSWFEMPDGSNTLSSQFYNIGENIIRGFIDGVSSLWDTAMKKIKDFGKSIISKGKEGTEEHSPSKAFKQIGAFVIEGFNIGLEDTMGSSFSLMDTWTEGITAYSPTVGLSVDTSALKYYDSADYARTISANVSANSNNQLFVDESAMKDVMKEAVLQALNDSNLATDMRRQADKEDQTIVQVGNRTVTDAVTTQKKANGYVFAT